MKIVNRQRRIRKKIKRDLKRLGLDTCRAISHKRDTRPLASITTRRVAVASAETITMATEHAQ